MHTFPPPPLTLKFRTTGFPQYGFKLAFSRYDLQPRGERLSDKPTCTLGIRPYTQPPVLHCSPAALAGMIAGPIVRTFQSRGPWLAGGFCCPTSSSLLWPHLRLSSPSPLYGLWRRVHARRSALGWVREGPHFPLSICSLRAIFRTPMDGMARTGCPRHSHSPSPSLHWFGIHIATIVGSQVDSVTRLQSSLYAAARRDC